jgi:hypothetical protein
MLMLAAAPVAARADVDLTGLWELDSFLQFGATIVQTGTSLSVDIGTQALLGTIDSATGAFSFGTALRRP